ncbi:MULTISPECIES: TetR/AcrR family transcriptional regulator [Mycobacteriaceae]|uniref:TetR/AcrR family transcriptional regulator n=1 Tax=Mycobacteriaceae TaxID=1762 RepID=UPI0007FE9F7D|nr:MULTISPECIES: TetR/AcrR family transcriptional regulator [Mycobacteriaceae]MCK0174851.1 TetR/AcrR family transcriptional regulator [Mycolicibacterium sp. F2034L]OBB59218.1 TetR family transcriptional regulator [Mycobacterium sp. 852013-51886_SCH5428379]
MTGQVDRRSDTTRGLIIRSAAAHFAEKSYGMVNLDDILADAAVTKGALYFHFRSKHDLATAIVQRWAEVSLTTVAQVVERRQSAMETLVDVTFDIALDDVADPLARAGFNLLESLGRNTEIGRRTVDTWSEPVIALARRAQADGDIPADRDPSTTARLLVAFYLGVRATTDVDDPHRYLTDLEEAWALALPGLVAPERLRYLTTLMRRRAARAIAKAGKASPA